jgi:hypothetical protein
MQSVEISIHGGLTFVRREERAFYPENFITSLSSAKVVKFLITLVG